MAVSLAEKLKTSLKLKTDLIEGRNGIFDVELDGKLVYSKNETGEFPDEESLVQKIKSDHSIG